MIAVVLQDAAEYPDHSASGYIALRDLHECVRQLCAESFDEPHTPSDTILD